MRARASISELPDTLDAADEALQALQLGGTAVDAALCFVTTHHSDNLPALVERLAAGLGTRTFAGCVSAGITIGDREVVGTPAVGIMTFSDPDPRRFSVRLTTDLEESPAAAARHLVEGSSTGDLIYAMITADHFNPRAFLGPLDGMEATLVGGGAANPHGEDRVFTGEGARGAAIASLRITDCQPVHALTHACRPISPLLTVTGCTGRLLTELGGRPALEVLREVLSAGEARRREPPRGQILVGLAPTPSGAQLVRGEYLVRPLMGLSPEGGALLVGESLSEGMGLAFVARDEEAARTDLNLTLLEARSHLGDAQPAFGIYVNCAGRGPTFQGIPDYDASVISAYLPGVPLGGFFGGFELAPVLGTPQIQFYTAVMAVGC